MAAAASAAKSGLAAEVTPAAAKDQKLIGSLKVGYLPRKSGGFEAIVAVTQPPPGIRPGMSGGVEVVLEEVRDAVLIPKSAVRESNGKATVRVLKNGDVEERDVVTGADDGKRIVIREGIAVGERVVVEAAQK